MKLVSTILLAFALSGCAAMQQNFVDNNCNYTGGYEYGTNAANKGEQMNSSAFNICPPEVKAEAKKGYMEGFAKASTNQATHGLLEGVAGVFSRAAGKPKAATHKYRCSGSLFGNSFYATGLTEGAAKSAANQKCNNSKDSIHCHSVMYSCNSL